MEQILQMLMQSNNPMAMLNNMYGNDATFQRAMMMAQGKDAQQLKEIALNLCQQRGMDRNEADNFFRQFGL